MGPPGWLTQYGFSWGPAVVTRMSSLARRKGKPETICIGIDTGFVLPPDGAQDAHLEKGTRKHSLHVYVSPTGRSVRCFLDGQEMLTSNMALHKHGVEWKQR